MPEIHPHPYEATDPETNPSCITCGHEPDWPAAHHVDADTRQPVDITPPELVAARVQHEIARMESAERAYDVAVPNTLRERLAYAKALAASDLVPRAFKSKRPGEDGRRETAANILLAIDLGAGLGLQPMQALCQVNVVEGKPGLSAEGMRAQVLLAGHDLWVDEERSDHEKAVIHGQREGSQRVTTVTYTLHDAVRAGLCRIVDGKPYARSSQGKPLPWELATPDMLVARATTRICKRVFPDVIAGMAVEEEGGDQWVAERPASVTVAAPAAADTVEADLALFPDGQWWPHAGATVRRRSKQQLAADRLQEAYDRGDQRLTAVVTEPADAEPEIADAEILDAEPTPEPAVYEAPAEAVQQQQEPEDFDPWATEEPADPLPDTGLLPVGENLAEPEPDALDRDLLWAEVQEMAANKGKTPNQLMARWVLANKVNAEDATAEQLAAFLEPYKALQQ